MRVALALVGLVASACAVDATDALLPIEGRDDLLLLERHARIEGGLSNELAIDVPDDLKSVLVEVRGSSGLFYLAKFETPEGELIEGAQYTTRYAREAPGLVDWLYPNTPTLALDPGPYQLLLRGEDASGRPLDEDVEIRIYAKKQVTLDTCGLRLDVLVDETAYDAKLALALDSAVEWVNNLYAPRGIRVLDYQITKLALAKPDFDPQQTTVMAQVDDVLAQARRKGIARDNSVHLIIVRSIGGNEPSGYSMGLPGPFDGDRPNAAVLVATTPYTDEQAGVIDAAGLGSTMAHEIGHYMGLYHTSESNGTQHDPLPDTPMAGSPDFGRNIMTPGGGAFRTSVTADQAFVIRNHPLCEPAERVEVRPACELSCTAPHTCSVASGVAACRPACDPADGVTACATGACQPDDLGTYVCL